MRSIHSIIPTCNGMLDLDARVNFNKVMSSLLINQEFCGSRIPVVDAFRELDRISPDRLADLFRKMRGGGNLDHFLVPALNRTITFKQVDDIAHRVSKELNFDMAGPFEETLDEDCSVAERGLCLGNCTLKCVLELRFFAYNTHATASATHGGLYDHWR